jgi:hypothetical protein
LDILSWYQHFILVKFQRALSGREDDWQFDEDLDLGFQTDYNGSAKIALIAAEKSLAALQDIIKIKPDLVDDVLIFMALLQKIIREGDHEFPDARKFIRPGFDEVDV